jgi:hypothetical protein
MAALNPVLFLQSMGVDGNFSLGAETPMVYLHQRTNADQSNL